MNLAYRRDETAVTTGALLALFEVASAAQLDAALGRWDPATRGPLTEVPAAVPENVATWIARHGSTEERVRLVANHTVGPLVLELLAADADVRTALFRHTRMNASLRRRILRSGELPPDLRAWLLRAKTPEFTAPALDAADPELAAHARQYALDAGQRPDNTPHAFMALSATERGRWGKALELFDLDAWTPADWAEIGRLHLSGKLPHSECHALVREPACPPGAALALLSHEHPGAITPGPARHALAAGTVTPEDLVWRLPHAAAAIRLIQRLHEEHSVEDLVPRAADLAAIDGQLRTCVRASLGAVPELWQAAADLLLRRPAFAGSIGALLRAAAERPAATPAATVATTSDSPLMFLLCRAEPCAVEGIVAALDPTALADLACYRSATPLPGHVAGAVMRTLSTTSGELLRQFARRNSEHEETRRQLLRLDDPEVNATVLFRSGVAPRDQVKVLSGTRYGPDRDTPLPLAPALHESMRTLLGREEPAGREHLPNASFWFGVCVQDADLVVKALERRPVQPDTPHCVAGCRRLAQLGRLDLLTELAEDDDVLGPETAGAVRATLDAHPGSAEQLLRALDAIALGHAAALIAGSDILRLEEYAELGLPVPWDLVTDDMTRRRTKGGVLAALARSTDVPEPVALAMIGYAPEACGRELATRSRPLALAALRGGRPSWSGTDLGKARRWAWILQTGMVTPLEFLERGRSALGILSTLYALPGEFAEVRVLLTHMLDTHLAAKPDAWSVATRLLPTFSGTVAELLATAQATGGS